jgi:acyl-CoA thioesterase FadM
MDDGGSRDAGPLFSAYHSVVGADWLDYNGHMHDASYAIALSDANEELFAALGLSADYRASTGASFYTVECHIRYLASCSLGDRLYASTMLVAADAKKLRLYTELLGQDASPVATGEALYLHVDATLGTTTAMPPDAYARVQDMLRSHAGTPRPAHLGRGVGAPRAGSGQR